ncbi:MAG: aminopeptidase [Candidatus Thorarchaeota archaeon]|jgi:aminopeptidase
MDPRIEEHAKILVEWSTEVKKGDQVVIQANPDAHELAVAVAKFVAKAGGTSITLMSSEEIDRAVYDGANEETLQVYPKHLEAMIEKTDAYVNLSSPVNTKALANVEPKRKMIRAKTTKPLFDIIMKKRWVTTVHPSASLAQQGNMSLEEYRDFVYDACLIDWEKQGSDLLTMKEHLENHKDIRFTGPETDLYASTEERLWEAADGKFNMPDGEVFTAPVETSVEGKIYFDVPFLQQGKVLEGVRLTFEKGEVVDYSAEKEEPTLKQLLEVDEGARRLGEMAIGTNRGIKKYTLNMLFDEKLGDTIHCALGMAYPECNGVNDSAIHVDMIKKMHEGEIYAGDELIYSKGKYFYEM